MTALWTLAGRRPDDVALEGGEQLTWAQLDDLTTRAGHLLAGLGAGPGSHVATVAGNSLDHVVMMIGAWRAGCVYSPLKAGWTSTEIGPVLDDAGTSVVVTDRQAAIDAAVERGLPVLVLDDLLRELLAEAGDAPLPEDTRGWKMPFTSGTTGRPKGVVPPSAGRLTFAESWGSLARYAALLRLPRDGVHLFVSQLFHGAPQTFGLGTLASGATLRLMARWDPALAADELTRGEVTSTIMVPTMLRQILALPQVPSPRGLVTLLHGGEPCPEPLKRKAIEWAGPVLVEYYGFTEGGMTTVTTEEWLARPGTVGKPMPGQRVAIVDESGTEVAPGVVGTVTVVPDTPGAAFHYLNDDAKTAESRLGKGFTVGDHGYVDADGFLFLTGRRADIVISSGVNIYPAEVERALADVEGIAELCAVGRPDPDRGESLVLYVALTTGADQDAVLEAVEHCAAERLATYKRPRAVHVVDALPRDETGKLLRRALRDGPW